MRINKRITLSMLAVSLALSAMSGAETADGASMVRADSLYKAGKYVEAVTEYRLVAVQGNPEAQFNLGYALYTGEGTDKNFTEAAMWFKRAAAQNYAKAQFNLAYCYMNGRGVPCDYDKALVLLKQSADNGYQNAQLTLSDCYAKGILTEQNEKEARRWKEMAEGKPTASDTRPATEMNSAVVSVESEKPKKEKLEGDITFALNTGSDVQTEENPKSQLPVEPAENLASVEQQSEVHVIKGPDRLKQGEKPVDTDVAQSVGKTQPPVIKILYPEDQSLFHTDNIKLKYQLIADGLENATNVTVMVDGQRQPISRAVKAANTVDVELPQHDCTVMIYAQNANGNSEPATIRLIRENSTLDMPRLFVVAIGIGDYNDPKLPKLKYTCKDAQDFSRAIASKKGMPYEDVEVKTLCDEEAKRSDIFEAMEWLKQEASPNDVCVFFYAGHGFRDEKDRFYFMPYGSSTDRLYDCFSSTDFRTQAEDINCKLVVFVDACYSGALMDGNRSAATNHFIEQLRRAKNGTILYASSSSDTKSKEDDTWKNGAFTKALVEAFNGAAREEGEDGLSTQSLEHFLYKEVRKTTGFKQTPIFINPNGIEHFNLFTYEK